MNKPNNGGGFHHGVWITDLYKRGRQPLPHRCRAANLADVKLNPGKVLAHCVLAEGHKSPHEDFEGHMWSKVVR